MERELLLKELAQEFGVALETLKQECYEIRQRDKLEAPRDIPAGSWNNVWNGNHSASKNPPLGAAHVNAERQVLSWMMQDKDTALIVQQKLGDRFHVEDHAALAAYLYAYYARNNDPDVGRFVAVLQDDRLERIASVIAMIDIPFGERELEDCIRTIGRASHEREVERLTEEQNRALREGDNARALQLGIEIIALEKQRKQ
jgi:DNA primase